MQPARERALELRLLQGHAEYRAAEDLQRAVLGAGSVWGYTNKILLAAQHNGGVVLGAFVPADAPAEPHTRLVGYIFSMLGRQADGLLLHYACHMAVLPAYRDKGIGYRLLCSLRQAVLDQDIHLITWTFEPLESRNAHLYIRKLGAVCRTYLRNHYGEMDDDLNRGLPSDRFQADWHIASAQVARRLTGGDRSPTLASLRAAGVPLWGGPDAPESDGSQEASLASERLLLALPANLQQIKAADPPRAAAWRQQMRTHCEAAFAAGYTIVDLVGDGTERAYLLERGGGYSA